jgi:DNA-binding CsgD family transcriptional regulator
VVQRFSKKLLFQIEDMKAKGNSVNQIAKKLKITPTDVQKGLAKIYEQEERS